MIGKLGAASVARRELTRMGNSGSARAGVGPGKPHNLSVNPVFDSTWVRDAKNPKGGLPKGPTMRCRLRIFGKGDQAGALAGNWQDAPSGSRGMPGMRCRLCAGAPLMRCWIGCLPQSLTCGAVSAWARPRLGLAYGAKSGQFGPPAARARRSCNCAILQLINNSNQTCVV